MNETTRFAAVYVRVSTEDQADLSPESQLEKITAYARQENIVILKDQIYQDVGISGKKASSRPEFMKMISAAKDPAKPFSVVLVWKFSRFARNQEESIFYKSILRSKCGVDVISVSEPLIAGHFGSLIERIIEWMDEFYSIRLSEEVKRSMEVNARKGKLQTRPPYGYKVQDGKLVPLPEESEIVRHIFRMFAEGKSYVAISRELHAMGVKNYHGNSIAGIGVMYILKNPAYIGKLRWNPSGRTRNHFEDEDLIIVKGEHEPIISQELWEKVQKRAEQIRLQNSPKSRPTSEMKHWISGLVSCSSCGKHLVISQSKYFRCNGYNAGICQTSQHITAVELQSLIIQKLTEDSDDLAVINCKVERVGSGKDELKILEKTLNQLQKKKERLQEAYLNEIIDIDDFSKAKKSIDTEIEKLTGDINKFKNENSAKSESDIVKKAIRNALSTLTSESTSKDQKHAAAKSIIETCIINRAEGTLDIVYRVVI